MVSRSEAMGRDRWEQEREQAIEDLLGDITEDYGNFSLTPADLPKIWHEGLAVWLSSKPASGGTR